MPVRSVSVPATGGGVRADQQSLGLLDQAMVRPGEVRPESGRVPPLTCTSSNRADKTQYKVYIYCNI